MAEHFKNIHELHTRPDYWGWVQGLYLAGNDDGVAMRLHAGQEYEPQSRSLWKRLCASADIVLDVGAHTGIYTLDARRAGAKEVISIEPYHLNFSRLVMNLRYAGVEAHSCALMAASDRNGFAQMCIPASNHYCSAGGAIDVEAPQELKAGYFIVPVRRLDTLIREDYHSRVSLEKIDTEKHGCKVLAGMPQILAHKPDIILECTEYGLGECLKPLGYKFYVIDEEDGLQPVENLVPDNPFSFRRPNRYATARAQ